MQTCRCAIMVFLLTSMILLTGCHSGDKRCCPAMTQDQAIWRQSFDRDTVGRPPASWRIAQTNPGKAPAAWQVVADPDAPSKPNVLALTRTENVKHTYNLAIADKTSFKNLDLTVSVKGVSGREDQGGGPIWRCIDENNYYICRINPLETNFRVYKVINGKRTQLQTVEVATQHRQWHTLRVVMIGHHVTCYLDGRKMLEARDTDLPNSGKVGLWTKADAASCFDDLMVSEVRGDNQ